MRATVRDNLLERVQTYPAFVLRDAGIACENFNLRTDSSIDIILYIYATKDRIRENTKLICAYLQRTGGIGRIGDSRGPTTFRQKPDRPFDIQNVLSNIQYDAAFRVCSDIKRVDDRIGRL